MLIASLAVLAGFVFLVWGADRFVSGASATADHLGIPSLVIGLVIVGFGTSAPEMLVSGMAAFEGNSGLGIGNALGSNIANIALILGTTALVTPLVVHSRVLRRELPILLFVTAAAAVPLVDGHLARTDGLVLLFGLLALLTWMIVTAWRGRDDAGDSMTAEFASEIPHDMPILRALLYLVIGLVVLLLGSRAVVWGAVDIAQTLGVSDLVIGLTIVAIGTSLPELAASLAGALKKEGDIAIGNIIGSNMFNLLAVMALPGIIHPDAIEQAVLTRDYPIVAALTVALVLMANGFLKQGKITRIEGGLLLLVYVGYLSFLYLQAQGVV